MKITVTEHEKQLIITALREINTVIALMLATKIQGQDPAEDGPEVGILSVDASV